MLKLDARPDRAHQAARRMRVGPEQKVPDFVRDGKPEHDRRIRAGLGGQPVHAVHVDSRQLSLADSRIHKRVSAKSSGRVRAPRRACVCIRYQASISWLQRRDNPAWRS